VVDADPEAIRADIEKLLEAKITQLGDRIRDLVDGTITLPGIDLGSVERIWPIVVNSEGLFLTPVLWSYLRDQTPALTNLDQPRVQPLTLFDLEDVERFFGLGAAGNSLIEILRSKTTLRGESASLRAGTTMRAQLSRLGRFPTSTTQPNAPFRG